MSTTPRSVISLAVLTIALAACGGGSARDAAPTPTITRELDSAALAALPIDSVTNAHRLCLATGYDPCPLRYPMAVRLDAKEIALWQPGRPIGIARAGDTTLHQLGTFGSPGASYATVMAIRRQGSGYEVVDVKNGMYGLVRLNASGGQTGRTPLPHVGSLATVGFLGGDIVTQDFRGWERDGTGALIVKKLRDATDTIGTTILEAPVEWMKGGSSAGPLPRPFFASAPLWTRVTGGDLIWSPGDVFRIERKEPSVTGAIRWVLTGPDGPRVTPEDMALREKEIRGALSGLPLTEEEFASMRSRSDSLVPPISGFVPYPDGGLLVMGPLSPSLATTTWLRLDPKGKPVSRFSLDSRARVLLAEGDSVLVHRPTESEPWEVVWMRLGR